MPSRGAPSRRLLRRRLSLVPRRKAASKRQHPQLPLRERREQLPSALPQRRGSWLIPVLIALVTCAAFLPTLQNQFVNFDDNDNFLDNPHYSGARLDPPPLDVDHAPGPLHPAHVDDPRPGLPAVGHESRRVSSDES